MSDDEFEVGQTQFAIVPVWIAEHGSHAILVYFAN